eukprot:jgi/Ulvmu1/637/UM010_0007.1
MLAFKCAVACVVAASAFVHVTMYPPYIKAEGEYNMFYFRVPYGCPDTSGPGGEEDPTYYPMEVMKSHIPAELVQGFTRVEWKHGWPAEVDKHDDSSATITWTGGSELANYYGLDLGVLVFVRSPPQRLPISPPQSPGTDEYVMETTVHCHKEDGSDITSEYLAEEAPRLEYGSECPAACGAGGYGG